MLHIAEMLSHAARVAPSSVAVTLDDDALTFEEIDVAANRIANGLRALWVGRGDRVLWWSDTALEAVPVFAALAKLGAVFAPLNARASVEEIAPVAEYAQPRILLCGSSHAAQAAELAERTGIPFAATVPTSDDGFIGG
jgi:acyl-CoA synthetase (AMP-forming)/AMP-acid ligase II